MQATTLRNDLFRAGTEGRVTPEFPVTAKKICEKYLQIHGWNLTDVQIRELVNHLRRNGEKIGSNTKGYFFILNKADEHHVAYQLESRAREILLAYHGMFPDRTDGMLFRMQSEIKMNGQQTIFQ